MKRKSLRRLLSMILAVMMTLGLCLTGWADEEPDTSGGESGTTPTSYSITINSAKDKYIYTAYQVFQGTLSEDSKTLSDIQWGADIGITDESGTTSIYEALAEISVKSDEGTSYPFTSPDAEGNPASLTSAAAVAEVLTDYQYDDAVLQKFAEVIKDFITGDGTSSGTTSDYGFSDDNEDGEGSYTISGLEAGYYFVETTTVPTDGAYTRYILTLVENEEITPKSDVPTVDKEVDESDIDANIGDTIDYTLAATMPSTYEDYETYKVVFHDTLSDGLTFDYAPEADEPVNSVTVKVYDSANDTSGTVVDSSCYIILTDDDEDSDTKKAHADCTFEILISDTNSLIAEKTDDDDEDNPITVTKNSIIVVTYTATLNENAVIGNNSGDDEATENGNTNKVYLEYSNNPNDDGTGTTGTTPEDTVVTFTFELDVTKVDGNSYIEYDADEYPDAESGYTVFLEGAEFVLYKIEDEITYYLQADENQVDSGETDNEDNPIYEGTGSYTVTGWTTDKDDAVTLTSAADGTFEIRGLDVGTYYLEETKAPDGYNKLTNPISITISATYTYEESDDGDAIAIEELTATVGDDDMPLDTEAGAGTIDVTVENNAGSTLPSTGGIGTTIFYIIGGLLAAGAAVLLIVKRRLGDAE